MKYLVALALAILLVVLPLAAAEASTIYLHVTPVPQYNENHHFNAKINAMGTIPTSDQTSFEAFAITGYFNSAQVLSDYGGAGIEVTSYDIYAYMYVASGLTPVCTSPAFPAFSGRGCLIVIPGLTLISAKEELIEWDYYPSPYNEWEAFARDNQNNYNFIGKFSTTEDWFTGINFDTALAYTTPNNPQYAMYALWQDPQGWIGGPNWLPFSATSVDIYVTNLNDTFVCDDNIYVIMRIGLLHAWYGGTGTALTQLKTCSGWLWTS